MSSRPSPIGGEEDAGGESCPRCGRGAVGSEHGIPIDAAVAAIVADPELPAAMDAGIGAGSCPTCGGRPWDVITARNGDGAGRDRGAARRTTLTLIRAQLALGRQPEAIASWIRGELGVVGLLVEGGSEVGRRLGHGWTPRPGSACPAAGRR